MKLKCIIVEDEPLAMERIRSYVERVPFLDLIAAFDRGAEARTFLEKNTVDLAFLDINLGEISGISLIEDKFVRGEVILTTAYHDYALKGFDLDVTDYLLKPFTFERFMKAVEKVKAKLEKKETPRTFIFIKTEYRLEKVFLNELLYVEGMRDYRRVHTIHKRIMTLQTFRDFEQEIPPRILCRVHKSWMVAPDKIESIERDRIRIRDQYIPVSETYKKDFFRLINKE